MIRSTPQSPSQTGYTQQSGQAQKVQTPDQQETPQPGTQQSDDQQDAYGTDENATASPPTYTMENGEFQCPPTTGGSPAAEVLALLDFEDGDDSGCFDPGVIALQQLVHDEEEANAEAMAAETNKPAPSEADSGQAAGTSGPGQSSQNADFDNINCDDPAILDIISKIRDAEFKNVKAMLDMIQQSLDRAKQLMERNMQDYYQKVLPQKQAIEAQVKQAKSNETCGNNKQVQAAAHQIGNLAQQLQQALAQNPQFSANPAAKNVLAALAVAQQLSTRVVNS
ncbi:MAG TPA: hypothetical protein V6D23_22570 [Candidatus Obscuribacterales bacterium]